MSWPLPDKYPPNIPLRDLVTSEWMQTMAGIVNYLVVEYVDGLPFPVIEKSATPSQQTPWKLLLPLPADSVELSDATPLPAAESGSPGDGTTASRSNHVHPIAHVDPPASDVDLRASTEASLLTLESAGTSWTRDLTYGVLVTRCVGVYYNHLLVSPTLRCYYQEEYHDALGRLYYVGPLQYYVIDTPTKVTWSS